MAKRVAVAGATGRLGREIVRELKSRGVWVRAVGRSMDRLRQFSASADELVVLAESGPSSVHPPFRAVDSVISCVGASVIPLPQAGQPDFAHVDAPINRALIDTATSCGVGHFVYVSVLSRPGDERNGFVRSHETVVTYLADSGLRYSVIRPTGFQTSLVEIMRRANWGLMPEARDGEARTNPIHEADLASFCANAICGNRLGVFEVGGPEVLTRKEIGRLVHGGGGGARRVPSAMLKLGAVAVRPFDRRVSNLMWFIDHVLSHDYVAPAYGSRSFSQLLSQSGTCQGSA